jgi:hypothetical protein
MKKLILLTLVSAFTLSMVAQDDDMYFVPTKENVAKEAKKYGMPQNTYYSGSNRSVDDYNRRAQFSYPADSVGNDIIDFSAVRGVYPDSVYSQSAQNDDYTLTRRMSRFDDYTPNEAYWAGYNAGRWSSPWRTSWYSWYDYDPWYWDSWYWHDPFYYSSWYGWRYPFYYSTWYSPRYYHSWYGGRWYGGSRSYRGASGRSWSRAGVTHHKSSSAQRGTDLGGYRSSSRTYTPSSSNSGLGGYRSSSSSSSSGSFSGGGGSRGGGFSGGGSSGGGRSVGGGHSYGGRR